MRIKKTFYSFFTDRKISDKKYDHVLLWSKFQTQTMKNYHYLCLKYDVSIIADVSRTSRNNHSKRYGPCPNHYLSAQGLKWDAMLKITKIELELNPDPDMYIFFEKGKRR